MSIVERAIAMAVSLHAGQRRKDGSPYIIHPLAVMLRFRAEQGHTGEVLRAAAVLHDVVEDCDVSVGSIIANVDSVVGDIVDRVSRRPEEPYADFIVRAAASPLGRLVKIADLEDNLLGLELLPDQAEAKGLRRRYEWALSVLR